MRNMRLRKLARIIERIAIILVFIGICVGVKEVKSGLLTAILVSFGAIGLLITAFINWIER